MFFHHVMTERFWTMKCIYIYRLHVFIYICIERERTVYLYSIYMCLDKAACCGLLFVHAYSLYRVYGQGEGVLGARYFAKSKVQMFLRCEVALRVKFRYALEWAIFHVC